MLIAKALFVLALAYLIGSIPFGLLVVRLRTGKDIRQVESGRTGGTNAMRAAGFWAGLTTAFLDIMKGALTVWLAQVALPGSPWVGVKQWVVILAPLLAVLGHNYSLFLLERKPEGGWRFRGGAGGAPTVGGAVGLWAPSLFIIIPIAALVFFLIGYASITTLSAALIATVVFAVRASMGLSPWTYVLYGLVAEIILVIALRPNIRRLLNGTERIVGLRAWLAKRNHA